MKMRYILFIVLMSLPAARAQEGPFQVQVTSNMDQTLYLFTVVDSAGLARYMVERERSYDVDAPSLHVFENSRLLVVDGYAGVIELYDSLGRMEMRTLIEASIAPNHERIVQMDVAADVVALAVSEPDGPTVSMYRIHADGAVTSHSFPGASHTAGIKLSSDGSHVAVGTYSWEGPVLVHRVYFGDQESLIGSAGHDFKSGAFGNGDSLFLLSGRSSAVIAEVRTGIVLSAVEYEPGSVVSDIVWERGTFFIALAQGARFTEGQWQFNRLSVLAMAPGKSPAETAIAQISSFQTVALKTIEEAVFLEIDGALKNRVDDELR